MKRVLLLLCLFWQFSCNQAKKSNLILVENNFDGLKGWGIESSSLTRERAYSGKYSVKIDANNEFSLGFSQTIDSITNKKPKRILVEFRAYIPSETVKARFVCAVTDPEKKENKFYQNFNVADKTADYGEWVKITKKLTLPPNIKLSDTFSCYLWRPEPGNSVVYMDDLKITILE